MQFVVMKPLLTIIPLVSLYCFHYDFKAVPMIIEGNHCMCVCSSSICMYVCMYWRRYWNLITNSIGPIYINYRSARLYMLIGGCIHLYSHIFLCIHTYIQNSLMFYLQCYDSAKCVCGARLLWPHVLLSRNREGASMVLHTYIHIAYIHTYCKKTNTWLMVI